MVTVRFHGDLKRFGKQFQLNVRDTAEAIRALICQLDGLRQQLQQGFYQVKIGKQLLDSRWLDKGLHYRLKDLDCIDIIPTIKGAKRGGVFQIIAGVVLIIASIYVPALAPYAASLIGAGAGLILSGVAMMLSPTPNFDNKLSDSQKKQSTSFSNLANLSAQGRPVPLAYGRILTGSLVISQGLETYDAENLSQQQSGFHKGD